MKRLFVFVLVFVLIVTGCRQEFAGSRKIHVSIPQHPWEEGSGVKLWYSLKWNNGGKIETVYLDSETREVDIRVSKKHTVYICAYPLGEMLPFGCALTPENTKTRVNLNQYEGYVAHLLINSNLEAAQRVNYDLLISRIKEKTDDPRTLDDSALVSDVMNGKLDAGSVEIGKKFRVESISIPDGKWVSESEYDGVLYVQNNKTGDLELAPGVYRYYCDETDREFRVTVDRSGGVFHSLRYGMIGL